MERELETACRLAREAGALVLEIYQEKVKVEWKTSTEPVTLADKRANQHIVEILHQEFPQDGILAEESPDTERRLSRSRVWMVDPVDGTTEFIKRNGEFAVMIGLAVEGKPVVGAVYQPTTDVLYYASAGAGAFMVRDGQTKRLTVSRTATTAEMCIAVSRSHRSRRIDSICRRLGLAREVQSGSVGLKVGLIAKQRCDLYIHVSNKTCQWDACAPDIILREAGGQFTDLTGAPLLYNRPDPRNWGGIVASNGPAHAQIVAATQAVLEAEAKFR